MQRMLSLLFISASFICISLISGAALAAIEVHQFDSSVEEARYQHLIDELRCLVCQNQNIADSNAGLAYDLRKKVYDMINAGQSDEQILNYMVERYGDFVLYRPPVRAYTLMLWFGPFALLLGGLILLLRFVRRRELEPVSDVSDEDLQRVRTLLSEPSGENN